MKKVWKLRKDDEGVSPVIATILMVAITVVLAAVLYVMVLGIGGDTGTQIIVSMTKDSTATQWTYTVTNIQGTTQLALTDCYVLVRKADQSMGLSATSLTTLVADGKTNNVTYIDANTANYLNSGDYFILDRSAYLVGSVITLTDASGQATYCTYTM